jgi:hypothetical protein
MEESPKEGAQPIHWMLTTSLPLATHEEAIKKVRRYMNRWRIERFHYTLKKGAFNIEKLQFDTTDRSTKPVAMYSVLAIRILYVLYHPDEDARTFFSVHELRAPDFCMGNRRAD